jgi:deoxyribodipyrimidine photolyase
MRRRISASRILGARRSATIRRANIRQWVPELAGVPAAKFMEAPADGKPIAAGYPRPMVDHGNERDETLRRFRVVA